LFPIKDNIPTERLPIVTIALIVINCVVYLFLQPKSGIDFSGNSLDQGDLAKYAAIPYEFTHWGKHCDYVQQAGAIACQGQPGVSGSPSSQEPTWLTAFTAMFSHARVC
jgi:membrane associated rhomboid family serine protease